MNKKLVLSKLHGLAGHLESSTDTTTGGEIRTIQRKLAEQLVQNPELAISGNWLCHEAAQQPESVMIPLIVLAIKRREYYGCVEPGY